jgi:hypothetical protein
MGQLDVIRNHLAGTADEKARREEILHVLLDAFDRGGAETVASELRSRLDDLEQDFRDKLQAVNTVLSYGISPCSPPPI